MSEKNSKKIAKILMITIILVLVALVGPVYAANTLIKNMKQEEKLEMVYVDSPYIETPDEQNIVIQWGNGADNIENMVLICTNEKGEEYRLPASDREDDMFRFRKKFTEAETGIYHLQRLSFSIDEKKQEYDIENAGINAYFGVNIDYQGNDKSEVVLVKERAEASEQSDSLGDISMGNVTVDIDNIGTIEKQVEELLAENVPQNNFSRARNNSNLVVVLDPGHDNAPGHTGAEGHGLQEHIVVLEIAKACKAKLETYEGVEVYLTREDDNCPYPGTGAIEDIYRRVEWANTKGADVFVSIHLNAFTSSNAWGAEVYYRAGNNQGRELSREIQDKLVALGLYNRGIKEGVFAVNTEAEKYGFPGVLVEHGFVSNPNDVEIGRAHV